MLAPWEIACGSARRRPHQRSSSATRVNTILIDLAYFIIISLLTPSLSLLLCPFTLFPSLPLPYCPSLLPLPVSISPSFPVTSPSLPSAVPSSPHHPQCLPHTRCNVADHLSCPCILLPRPPQRRPRPTPIKTAVITHHSLAVIMPQGCDVATLGAVASSLANR